MQSVLRLSFLMWGVPVDTDEDEDALVMQDILWQRTGGVTPPEPFVWAALQLPEKWRRTIRHNRTHFRHLLFVLSVLYEHGLLPDNPPWLLESGVLE